MKLWDKGQNTDKLIENFTVGRDREFDILLAPFDVLGSMAHATMLKEVGLLQASELEQLLGELKNIYQRIEKGEFTISNEVEDVHSQVEFLLTQKLGEAGKKIHTGRSRNDQVLVDTKLYLRSEIKQIVELVEVLFSRFQSLSEQHKNVLLPGYTHFQVAMPSSFGLWFGAYAEALTDDLESLLAAYKLSNKNPLGSGAGYGSTFPLNRTLTTELLGFESLHYNVVYAQMSRGKTEKALATGMASVAATLARLSMDVCLYMSQNMGFVTFPAHLTTGSSIMPHKKNPDVFELIRAKCNRLQSVPQEIGSIIQNLPSGYHRDMQLVKESLFPAIEELKSCLQIADYMLANIIVKDNILDDAKYDYLFSVEVVHDLVKQGLPFREAYKQVGSMIEDGAFKPNKVLNYTHEGSIGNLCNTEIKQSFIKTKEQFQFEKTEEALRKLAKGV